MVGDRYWEDIFGANRLGMITVKISRGQHSNETIEGAFENALKSEPMKIYFIKNYSKKEIMTLMKPAHTIDSLLALERLILDIEKNL
jgi:FMN phosphatase YigB (HAD superfamily)